MTWRITISCLLAAVAIGMPIRAAVAYERDEPDAQVPAANLDLEALVGEAESLIDVVLQYHVTPPTRQEMWSAGVTRMVEPRIPFTPGRARITPRAYAFGPSERILQMHTADELVEYLQQLRADKIIPRDRASVLELKDAFLWGVLEPVPGNAHRIPQSELKAREQVSGNRYVGTGIANAYDDERGYPTIGMVIPGGPMARAGGRDGDLILKIDSHGTHKMATPRVLELLRGEEGTTVAVELCAPDRFRQEGRPGAAPGRDGPDSGHSARTITVTRGPVILETLEGFTKVGNRWSYKVNSHTPIWYVKAKLINGSTVHDLRLLERQFRVEGAGPLILDFRSTHTEDVHYAILLADALLDGGLIGRVRTKDHAHELHADRDCLFRDWPLAVLVNNQTRRGAELVAAAVQDHRRGLLIGDRTAGEAYVESTIVLPGSGDGLRLVTGFFERPSGESFLTALRPWTVRIANVENESTGGIQPDRLKPGVALEAAVKEFEDRLRSGGVDSSR